MLVTSLDRARPLPAPAVVIEGAAWVDRAAARASTSPTCSSWPDYSRICQHYLAERLWKSAGMRPQDMDVAEVYDCFSAMALLGMEGLGLAPRGGAGEMVRAGETALGGALPVNTHGGLLFEGYLHGMNTLAEAVQQLQGRGGARQVKDAGPVRRELRRDG